MNINKILLTGGGTLGSVSPLLAIAEELNNSEFLWVGTNKGLEREIVERENIKFKSIVSGKLRRYFSFRNFIDPFLIIIGLFQSIFIMIKWRPNMIITAGSFVSVPVVIAGWILKVPSLIHQQDVRPGLANKLMAPFAKKITVSFEKSLADYGKKAVWTGNPTRHNLEISNNKPKMTNYFDLQNDLPVVLVMGGGTGAKGINNLISNGLDELTKFCQVIHITGKNKVEKIKVKNYYFFESLNIEEITEAYRLADVVVSRCGMGSLTELSCLGKPSILIPIPDSHQEENAEVFAEKDAAIVLDQKKITPEELSNKIKNILNNREIKEKLSNNIKNVMKKNANKEIIKIINS